MSLDLTSLVGGANRLLAARNSGTIEGRAQRDAAQERARQAARQALQDSILSRYRAAQEAHLGAQTTKLQQPVAGKLTWRNEGGEDVAYDAQGNPVRRVPRTQSPGVTPRPRIAGTGGPTAQRPGSMGARAGMAANLIAGIVSQADALERQTPDAPEIPTGADIGASVAQRVLGSGAGNRLAERIRSTSMTDAQNDYNRLREQFMHSMVALYPRASMDLMRNMADAYFAQPGEPASTIAAKRRSRAHLTAVLNRTQGGPSPEDIAATLPPEMRSQFLAETQVGPTNHAAQRMGPGVAPQGAPAASGASQAAVNRYLARIRGGQP